MKANLAGFLQAALQTTSSGGSPASYTLLLTADQPPGVSIDSISRPNVMGTGAMSVTVVGSNIGQSHANVGQSSQLRSGVSTVAATSWSTTTTVTTKTTPAQPQPATTTLTVVESAGSLTVHASYDTSGIDVASLASDASNLAGTGSMSVTVV
eukprot:CAMPEP_0175845896 /NCGR_PEP_ID=MMETSP0107_2-20121207/22481_1 /TAXON_ID=195067 ORGANISM="Goniomonas pacifica, Strain CCMP1869" /NCGR_SAMPLE_ID=MMETSP0107_2 /ASSEMBLY_ACC=CAM_ASM_000203 /LENGTH=152 /DNA_ID=CAMNT_0017160509 /DNA_START=56 /DNA_END=510 /DNA_ORIENTATION=+